LWRRIISPSNDVLNGSVLIIADDRLWNLAVEAVGELADCVDVAGFGLFEVCGRYFAQRFEIVASFSDRHSQGVAIRFVTLLTSTYWICHLET
jgi:hypothetical protein